LANDAVNDAVERGATVFVKIGGQVYQIPEERALDAAAFLTDLKSRFIAASSSNSAGRGYPFSLSLSYGARGVLVDLDNVDYFTKELREELGNITENEELAENLAEYMAKSAQQYLNIRTSAERILNGWNEAGSIDRNEPDEDE
jgi:hypothetical protein